MFNGASIMKRTIISGPGPGIVVLGSLPGKLIAHSKMFIYRTCANIKSWFLFNGRSLQFASILTFLVEMVLRKRGFDKTWKIDL